MSDREAIATNEAKGVLCSGSIIFDTLVQPFEESAWGTTTFVESMERHVGGNGANTARALAILGTPVRLLGALGDDAQAEFILEKLRNGGVDTSHIARMPAPTAATIVLVNRRGDRQFLHRLGISALAFERPVEFTPDLCRGMAHYHLASLFILPHMRIHGAEVLRRARAAGLTTSLDTNWDAEGKWMDTLRPCLEGLDILFMNEDEARMVTGWSEAARSADMVLKEGVKTAVMKLGPRGCAIYTGEDEILCPAFDVVARDTTGAGDCFAAGFLTARQRGASWREAGQFANAAAALSVETLGAVSGMPTFEEVEKWMRAAPVRTLGPSYKPDV
ncbi:MAG TPA: carbohydrate kinase family protein [Bryobacteraceae bacterium]